MTGLRTYQDTPIREIIVGSVPWADASDALVFLMGPYRLLDPSYLYPDDEYPLPPDPLAPESDDAAPDAIQATLRSICRAVSAETQAALFIASDVEIPTKQEVTTEELAEPGMAVIDQSVAFATASDGNAFVFTKAGLTTGAGAEAGAVPEHFSLRDTDAARRDPRTFCIFSEAERSGGGRKTYEPKFSSASIDEMDDAYSLRFRYFVDRDELEEKLIDFVESYVIPL
ncbi:hypothetical protein C471_14847 [Halorubrum saccharovorum DSM 1137]|uniref:DUF7509 domain-containing protein n=1 Tax=Halorubrum saccharovorum DSM 1137 TaxID=1227484 RepID=M0DN23_9EURY|nr:hypothetical protein [Halorubrum saccharovorum]ELZ36097.1 hypothetical protein C471_14847 [Halorubrum saccharovorum DSM 1137]